MRALNTLIATTMTVALLNTGNLQAQDLPRPSPESTVQQRVGLTDVSVTYSRPGVKERKIWGELVPYGEMWRVGANERTVFTSSDDIMVAGQALPAGTYGLLAIPGEAEWEFIFSKVSDDWGVGDYKKENDALRVKAKPMMADHVERLMIGFTGLENAAANLTVRWEKLSVSVPFTVDVDAKAMVNIEKAISEAKPDDFRVYRNAANYCSESGKDLEQGLKWIEKSISIKESWYSYWVKADVLAGLKKYEDAIASAQKSIEMGEAAAKEDGKDFKYGDQLREEITKWKSSMK